jgi:hypothetical protein
MDGGGGSEKETQLLAFLRRDGGKGDDDSVALADEERRRVRLHRDGHGRRVGTKGGRGGCPGPPTSIFTSVLLISCM